MSEQQPPGPPPAAPQRVAPPPESQRRPARVEPVPGTPYGLAIYGGQPETSGPSVGALVAGIASILVAFLVTCLGLAEAAQPTVEGSSDGWGALTGGAFAVLAGFLGAAGIGLGLAGMRQTRRARQSAGEPVRGRGMAIAGLVCGAVGVVLAICSIGLAILVALD